MATKTYAEALLKDVYLPTIIKLEREHSVLQNRLVRTARDIRGNDIISPTMVQSEQGISNRARDGDIHDPSAGEFVYATAKLKYMYGAVELHGQDRILSEGNTNERIAEILSVKIESLGSAFATDVNRQLWSDGVGILSLCEVGGPSTTVNVADISKFRLGMYVDVHDNSGSAWLAQDSKITALTDDGDGTGKITIEDSITTAADDQVIRAGNVGATAGTGNWSELEFQGLKAMISNTGTYLGLDRAVYPAWASYVDSTVEALSLIKIDTMFGKLIYNKDAQPSIVYCDEETVRWIKYLYQSQGIPLDYMTINLGYRAIQYTHPKGVVPIVIESMCPTHSMWTLDERYNTLRQPKPVHWMPGYDGYWRMVDKKDKEIAYLRYYAELFNVNPGTCGKMTSYTTPVS